MSAIELTQIGDSLGVILPKDVLARLNIEKGDKLFLSEAADSLTLSTSNPAFDEQMDEARRIMRKRSAVLHELAK